MPDTPDAPTAAIRIAGESDVDGVVRTISAAFADDPLWSWAFPDRGDRDQWWTLFVGSALRYQWTWIKGDYAAVSVWIPPGGSELSDEEEGRVPQMLEGLLGRRAGEVAELLERFESSHPREEPHYYLSLLGTHPHHRGNSVGMSLLGDTLAMIDLQGVPAYLESSNPANDHRYERVGFVRIGEFSTPDGSHTVATMWRQPRTA